MRARACVCASMYVCVCVGVCVYLCVWVICLYKAICVDISHFVHLFIQLEQRVGEMLSPPAAAEATLAGEAAVNVHSSGAGDVTACSSSASVNGGGVNSGGVNEDGANSGGVNEGGVNDGGVNSGGVNSGGVKTMAVALLVPKLVKIPAWALPDTAGEGHALLGAVADSDALGRLCWGLFSTETSP